MMNPTNNCSMEYFGGGTSTTNQDLYQTSYRRMPSKRAIKIKNLNQATALGKSSNDDWCRQGFSTK